MPLGFHRGLTFQCIEAWTRSQTYPRDRYQLVIAAPHTTRSRYIAKIREYLHPLDKLQIFPWTHDIKLIAEGAKLADGELLLFTESHCIPEPQALFHLLEVLANHPEWVGFSSVATLITHNFLSRIEAKIYDTDIRQKLEHHPWLKVMDQCFIIQKSAYFNCGGFEPEYGHFAEWLLSASLYRTGYQLGFDLTPIIRHYYIGKLKDLKEFTLDFAYGQIKFAAESQDDDPRSDCFPSIPELEEFRRRKRGDFFEIARLQVKALPTFIKQRKEKPYPLRKIIMDQIIGWFKVIGLHDVPVLFKEFFARQRLKNSIRRKQETEAQSDFIDWFCALVQQGYGRYIKDSKNIRPVVRNSNFSRSSSWTVSHENGAELLGFYGQEEFAGKPFRWSRYAAGVYIPLCTGEYHLALEWEEIYTILLKDFLYIEFDGKPIAIEKLSIKANKLIIEVKSELQKWHKLLWVISPLTKPSDRRLLGLPLSKISWLALD